ncbi:hypothetical protein [Mycoplasma todarodis]|uniref:Uncharacterized protein n=1 Tax=Mycoplasma todarodis TaxID=1937191 RepID=A0A4R0XJ65_9MOLU|nr:hypothetical protein [Mycoplasma todarodis]TCG10666.1 hypothetical protein C4B25_03350 [Mycoplasma todarodis]
MKQDYYAEIIKEIKELIQTNPTEAAKKLEVELNMPYIPERYEAKFINLLEELKFKIKQDAVVNNELSRDEVLDILMENDSIKMPMAMAKLKELNLRSIIDDLHKLIAKESTPNMIKTIVYEYCVEQGIDHNFDWNDKVINPKIVGSVVALKTYLNTYMGIEKIITKNPSLEHVAKTLLELYSLNTFPDFIDEPEGLENVIINIAYESMGLPSMVTVDQVRMKHVKEYIK